VNSWYMIPFSCMHLTQEEKIFLSYYTEESFIKLFPEQFLLSMKPKTTFWETIQIVRNWINTGEWKYEY